MNLGNYNFHTDSKKHLIEFLQTVKRNELNNQCQINANDWKRVFKHSQKINISSESRELETDIVDLTIGEDSNLCSQEGILLPSSELQDIPSSQQENAMQEIVYAIANNTIEMQNDFLTTFEENCNIDIKVLFEYMLNTCDTQILFKFGHSLLSSNCSDKLSDLYFKCILIPSAISQLTDEITQMFGAYVDKCSAGVLSILLEFLNTNGNIIIELLSSLNSASKLKLFEDCVTNSVVLEVRHIRLLDNLIIKETTPDSIKKLINLLIAAGDIYSTDKVYGKFLIKLIDLLGTDVKYFQAEISILIEKHKSIWKNKAEKLLMVNLESDVNITQSFLV